MISDRYEARKMISLLLSPGQCVSFGAGSMSNEAKEGGKRSRASLLSYPRPEGRDSFPSHRVRPRPLPFLSLVSHAHRVPATILPISLLISSSDILSAFASSNLRCDSASAMNDSS